MKARWVVVWKRDTGTADGADTGQVSGEWFANEQQAMTNLEARLNQPRPDIRLPKKAYVATTYIEVKP